MRSPFKNASAGTSASGCRHERLAAFSRLLLAGLVAGLVGCGGGSTAPTSNAAPNLTLLLQDAPANGVAAFNVDVTGASFNGAGGQAVALSSPAQAMELRHMQLSPTVALETFASQPGTYNSLTFTLANPQLTVLNGSGQIVRLNSQTTPAATLAVSKVTVPLTVTVGNPGHVNLMLDFDVGSSISNDRNGNYIITPVIHAGVLSAQAPPVLRGALGTVIATFFNGPNVLSQVPINALGPSGSHQQFLEIQLHDSGQAIPVAVDSSTIVDAALGGLANVHMAESLYVSASLQSNGTFLASSIAAGPSTRSQHYQGLVTGVQRNNSGGLSFSVVVQN